MRCSVEYLDITREVKAYPTIRVPRHLVHPEHGKRDTWDVRGETVCPTCSTRWRTKRDNSFEIVALARA